MRESDLGAVLALNNSWVPEVSEVDRDRLVSIVGWASLATVATDVEGRLLGVVIVVPPGTDYDSPNYERFCATTSGFRYVDRIIVDTMSHRGGVGRRLYEAVFEHAESEGATTVTCEVNVDPPNPASTAFHGSLGFVEVGRQSNYDGAVTVAFMSAPLTARG